MLRAEIGPRWNALALIVAGLAFPASRIGEVPPLAVVDDAVFLAALAPLGIAMLRGADPLRGD